MSIDLPATSSVKILTPVTLLDTEGNDVDLSAQTVEYTTLAPGVVPDGTETWHAGSWELSSGIWHGLVVVGPAGVFDPGAGVWALWCRVTTSDQSVAMATGTLVLR